MNIHMPEWSCTLPTSSRWTEDDLLRGVRKLAAMRGWLAYHTLRSKGSEAGFPDLVLVRPPRVLFVELKADRGRTTEAQDAWLAALRECPGVETCLWRPRDLEAIGKALE